MPSQRAIVKSVRGDTVEVEVERQGCGGCGGCGAANLAAFVKSLPLFGGDAARRGDGNRLELGGCHGLRVDDEIEITFDEAVFARAVLLQYLLPLAIMLVVTAAAAALTDIIWAQIAAAIVGLGAGIRLARARLAGRAEDGVVARGLRVRPINRSARNLNDSR